MTTESVWPTVWMLTGYCASPSARDRLSAALPVVTLELQRAVLGLLDFVGDDVAVGECQPEAASGAAGLEVGAAVLEGLANIGRAADVELTADDAALDSGSRRRLHPR